MQRPRGLNNLQYANDIRTLFTAVQEGPVLFGSDESRQYAHRQRRPEGRLLIAATSSVGKNTVKNPFVKCCLVSISETMEFIFII